MADDEQSIETEEDKRSFVEASIDTEDEKRDDQVESQGGEIVDGVEGGTPSFEKLPIQDESEIDQGNPSVLVAAAMSSQRQGNKRIESHTKCVGYEPPVAGDSQSFDDTSAAHASIDANLWENYDDTSQGGSTDMDRSLSVQVDARYLGEAHTNSDDNGEDSSTKLAEESGHTDDGYVPDAEVTEEEYASRIKNDDARKIRFLDGYVPDAELTEEEHPKKIPKKKEGVVAIPRVTENASIDEGYVPDDTLTEEERVETLNTCVQVIDGYFPDGHTTLREAEEEDDHFHDKASIDDAYMLSDVLTEEEGVETHNMSVQGIDAGYLAGHTPLIDSDEDDDQCYDKAGVTNAVVSKEWLVGEELSQNDGIGKIDSAMKESFQDLSATTGTTMDSASNVSTLEGAEEALSKEEHRTTAEASDVRDNACREQTAPDGDDGPSLHGGGTQEGDVEDDVIVRSDLVATPTASQQDQDESEAQGVTTTGAASLGMHGTDEFDSGEMKIDERSFRNDVIDQNRSRGEIESNAVTTPKDTKINEDRATDVVPGVDTSGRQLEVEPARNLEQAKIAEANVTVDEIADATQLTTGDVLSNTSEISLLDNALEFKSVSGDRTTQHDDIEDFSRWTFNQLRNKLYEMKIPVRREWRKKDLVDWFQNHFANHVHSMKTQNLTSLEVERSAILEDEQKADSNAESGDDSLKPKAASITFNKQAVSASISSMRKPETSSTSVRRSARGRKPSLKSVLIQGVQHDNTPISELSNAAHSETDEDSRQEQNSASKTEEKCKRSSNDGPSPGVPTAIVTRRMKGRTYPSLPVVPEGRIVEGTTVDSGLAAKSTAVTDVFETDQKVKSNEAESARSGKGTPLNRQGDESASDNASVAPRTRREKSVAANTYVSIASETGVCTSAKLENKEVPPKGGSGRQRKKVDEGSSIASTRRSTRSLASTVNDPASLGTRQSNRRAKK
jgi:hypothetical protein